MQSWAPHKSKWPPGCTPHRDGWVRWYKGKTRFVCAKDVPLDQVEDRWIAKKKEIDAESPSIRIGHRTYRDVMSLFMEACELRVKTGKPRKLAERTLGNYDRELNQFGKFVGGGSLFSNTNRPEVFAKYATRFGKWSSTGFDSVVSRVGVLYRWAAEMEYIDRWRPGPQFQRPGKQNIRDERIGLVKSIEPKDIAKLYLAANLTMKCWIGLGICAGFTNTDIANLPRQCVDLDAGIVDYRRRKTGKIRRVCPLPVEVLADLRKYVRPDPAGHDAGHFFLSVNGHPYGRTGKVTLKPTDVVGQLWTKLRDGCELPNAKFTGLRTTLFNLWPRTGYDLERKIVIGRAKGTIDLDSYLEDVGIERIRHGVNSVWSLINNELNDATLSVSRTPAQPKS